MIKRRTLIKASARVLGLAALAGLYTWKVEPYWLEFVHRQLPVRNLTHGLKEKT